MSSTSADGRVVMLSGANRGIGACIAARLAADGYRLSLGARRPDALAGNAPDVGPDRLMLNRYEANDIDTARRWVEATVDRFGEIDVLVNCAGIVDRTGLESMDEDMLDEMWAVNVKGPLRLTRLALPHLRRSGTGRVINMASMSAKRVKGDALPGYSMTKYALLALSHAVRPGQLGRRRAGDRGVPRTGGHRHDGPPTTAPSPSQRTWPTWWPPSSPCPTPPRCRSCSSPAAWKPGPERSRRY